MIRVIYSSTAEAATTELMYTLAAQQRWRRTRFVDVGRSSLSRGTTSPRSIEHLTVPYVAAVAEEFAHSTLLEASEPLVPRTHAILKQLWRRAEAQAEQWEGMADAWKKWHGINIRSEKRYQTLRGVTEARNAIVHGLGELTRRQIGADGGTAARARLARVGISTAGTRLFVDEESVRKCVQAARDFIEWLDNEAVSRGLRPLRPL